MRKLSASANANVIGGIIEFVVYAAVHAVLFFNGRTNRIELCKTEIDGDEWNLMLSKQVPAALSLSLSRPFFLTFSSHDDSEVGAQMA